MSELQPDRLRTIMVGGRQVHVDLWRGIFRDEVRAYMNVWPALGGLVTRRTCRRGRGDALFDEVCALVAEPSVGTEP